LIVVTININTVSDYVIKKKRRDVATSVAKRQKLIWTSVEIIKYSSRPFQQSLAGFRVARRRRLPTIAELLVFIIEFLFSLIFCFGHVR